MARRDSEAAAGRGHGWGAGWATPGGGVALLVAVILLAPIESQAHKVSLFAAVAGDSIRAEAYFSDGSPCTGAAVTVRDTAGAELAVATTDSLGRAAFPLLGTGSLNLVVLASMGHRAEFELTAAELGRAGPGTGGHGQPAPSREEGAAHLSGADDELVRRVEAALDRRLGPLEVAVHRLEKAQDRTNLKDAAAGVGFILGLAGLWSLLVHRGRKP